MTFMPQDNRGKVQENQSSITTDSLTLGSVAQAIMVMKLFQNGATENALKDYLQNEVSLSKAYLIFFKQMGLIECCGERLWRLTSRGKKTSAAFEG